MNNNMKLMDCIYDTLMGNLQYPQLNIYEVDNQILDHNNNTIEFTYHGKKVKLHIEIDDFNESQE